MFVAHLHRCICAVIMGLVTCGDGARILFHMPTPIRSHNGVYEPVIREMAKRGHQVVSITTEPMGKYEKIDNLLEIDVSAGSLQYWKKIFDSGTKDISTLQACRLYDEVFNHLLDIQLSDPKVTNMIKNQSEHFDLIVVEWFKHHVSYGWGYRFKAPIIGLMSLEGFINGYEDLGNPSHPYLVINPFFDFIISPKNTFWQRLFALYLRIIVRIDENIWATTARNEILRKHFGKDAPCVSELSRNISMTFVNQNEVFNRRSKVPACMFMNMMQIREPKPLPKDLRHFFDASSRGVVYFSLGSNVKSKNLPKEKLDILIKAFSQLPYDVLWKMEKPLPNLPENVKLCHWCPQQDILAQKNLKLFVTQGGAQSLEEAIHYKIPILGIPMIADQKQNIRQIMEKGGGELLHLDDLNEDTLLRMVMKIINDQSYKISMAKLAELIEDQPMKPLEKVVWWMEYVLRHRGAEHLKAPVLPWYLYFMLDAVLFVIVITALLLFIAFKIWKIVCFKSLVCSWRVIKKAKSH